MAHGASFPHPLLICFLKGLLFPAPRFRRRSRGDEEASKTAAPSKLSLQAPLPPWTAGHVSGQGCWAACRLRLWISWLRAPEAFRSEGCSPPSPARPPAVQGVHPIRAGNALPPTPARLPTLLPGWVWPKRPFLVPKTLVFLCAPRAHHPRPGWSVWSVFMVQAGQVCGSCPSLRAVSFLSRRVGVLSGLRV